MKYSGVYKVAFPPGKVIESSCWGRKEGEEKREEGKGKRRREGKEKGRSWEGVAKR